MGPGVRVDLRRVDSRIVGVLRTLTPDDFPGASVSGEVPVPAAILDRLVHEALAGRTARVRDVRLEPLAADQCLVHVTLGDPWPAVRVLLRIEEQPEADTLRLGLRWSVPGGGLLARLASPAIQALGVLPPGLTIDGGRATVDLRTLAGPQAGPYLALVRRLAVHTRPGALVLSFDLAARS